MNAAAIYLAKHGARLTPGQLFWPDVYMVSVCVVGVVFIGWCVYQAVWAK